MEDKQMRKILSGTKIPAGDNLKFRIMQQIETESALSKKKAKSSFSTIGSMYSIFGVMYVVISLVLLFVYFSAGQEAMKSTPVYLVVILISSVCSLFWMLSVYDEKRRKKNRKEK